MRPVLSPNPVPILHLVLTRMQNGYRFSVCKTGIVSVVPERRDEGGRDAGALGEPSVREPRSDL